MERTSDVLVLGSGLAGLGYALKVAEFATVNLVTKRGLQETSTSKAQGGIAAVLGADDRFEYHIQDTLTVGEGLSHPDIVGLVVRQGPERIAELVNLGAHFDVGADNGFDLGREGGHSHRRIIHAHDMTGAEVERILAEKVLAHPNIQVFENHMGVNLITEERVVRRGRSVVNREANCLGAYILNCHTGEVDTFTAPITLLATGGAGKVYLYTSNPDVATGDGVAMAFRAGAAIGNMEFVQFHPTCLFHPEAKNFLISEALRGEGAILKARSGEAFMEKYHSLKDLAPRDTVARAIDLELKKSGEECVYLDISHRAPDFVSQRFPNIYQQCLEFGIDITKEPIPVVPAAHYMCGGVVTDAFGRTSISHLYAVGEVSMTGLHGANRLASNSLLEALVFSHQAALAAKEELPGLQAAAVGGVPEWNPYGATDSEEAVVVTHNWDEIRRCMWNYVGIVRTDRRLLRAQHRIDMIQQEIQEYYWNFLITSDLLELRNIATVADLIIRMALRRKESRGLHYNLDYPQRDDQCFHQDTIISGEGWQNGG
ncbi:MAG: L-aspartate oxidase [Syntrophales bacterium]|nr:L-aspartate oxidase [Syntrophales bacterium]MDD5642866.1 L-aspartate oxidase [Syntrophales bacterium]